MDKIFWIVMVVIAGAFLPMQGSMNSKLAKAGENPVYASMISFTIGVLALVAYILLTSQNVSWKGLKDAPSYSWLGGVLGAFYVTVIVFAFPKIGPGLTFGLVVAGQLITSMVMEHFQMKVLKLQIHLIPIQYVLQCMEYQKIQSSIQTKYQ